MRSAQVYRWQIMDAGGSARQAVKTRDGLYVCLRDGGVKGGEDSPLPRLRSKRGRRERRLAVNGWLPGRLPECAGAFGASCALAELTGVTGGGGLSRCAVMHWRS